MKKDQSMTRKRVKRNDVSNAVERARQGDASRPSERAIEENAGIEEERPDETADALQFRLARDLRASAATLSVGQARFLVDTYYQVQKFRIEAAGQVRAATAAQEPSELTAWLATNMKTLEGSIRSALDEYSDAHRVGRWAKSQKGIGPVLAAGLLAHIDVGKAKTAGSLWRFAGLDPSRTWSKGEKRPWNARLKVVCWKLGESFVKVSGAEDAVYGRLWAEEKARLVERNERGEFADAARAALAARRFGAETQARGHYEAGHLPPAHVHARAKRWVVKLFLSHYHEVAWQSAYGTPAPKPYVIAIQGHQDYVAPPGWPCE